MKVLISGATGFFGSQTALKLHKEGHDITVLKRDSSVLSRLDSIIGTVKFYDLESDDISNVFKENSFDVILHFATNYGRKGQNSFEIIYDNLLLSIKLLEESIINEVPRFINIDTLLDPFVSKYTLSKKQFVEWGNFLSSENNLMFINLKFEHLYGPEDDETKFVTWIAKQMLTKNETIELTDGTQIRDFLFIDDAVEAVSKVLYTKELKHFEFEIGGGNPISVKDFILILKEEIESKLNKSIVPNLLFGALKYRAREQFEIIANTSRIEELGWKSKISHRYGLEKLVEKIL